MADDLYAGLELVPTAAPGTPAALPKAPPSMYDGLERVSAPGPRPATGFAESVQAGWQGSAPGLAWRRKLPDLVMNPETAKWWELGISSITQIGAELPIMIPAAAGGAALAAPAGPVASFLGAGFAMGVAPATIRQSLIEGYKAGAATTPVDWFNAVKEVAMAAGKEGGINALSMGAGGLAKAGIAAAGGANAMTSKAIGLGAATPMTRAGAIGSETVDLATQLATMVSLPAAMEGRLPTLAEFIHGGVVIGGLKGAHVAAKKMMSVYEKTGKTPIEQVADVQAGLVKPEDFARPRQPDPVSRETSPEMAPRATEAAAARISELATKAETALLTDAERAERIFLINAKPDALAKHFDLTDEKPTPTRADIDASADRIKEDVLRQLREADQARRDTGQTPLGDDHAEAVATLVRARIRTRAERLGMLPEDLYNERPLQIRDEAQAEAKAAEAKAAEAPAGATMFTPPEVDLFGNPVEVTNAPRFAVEGLATIETPLEGLILSKEVPQFKKDANEKGVVIPLGGKFDRTGVGPIQVWERMDGTREIISGRHRWDLAVRSGETTIPAQIHREADGFTARKAAVLDAMLNIREEQGSIADYVQYFKDSGVTKEAAELDGLLARAKGRSAFAIARDASPDLAAAHRAGLLSDDAAFSISAAAPGSDRLQALGISMVQQGKSALMAVNTMKAVEIMAADRIAEGKQGDIFGFDDSAMREASAMAKKAGSIQMRIQEQIAAVNGASKRPELARRMGVDVADPEGIQKRIVELRQEQYLWDNWPLHPELVARLRGEEPPPVLSPPSAYAPEVQAALDAAKTEHESTIEFIKRNQNQDDVGARLKGEGMRYAALKRQITGELTAKEQAAKDAREAGNYIGKEVLVDGFEAKVTANPFGKVTVQFADGVKKTVDADQVQPKPITGREGELNQGPVGEFPRAEPFDLKPETPAELKARDEEAAAQAKRKLAEERRAELAAQGKVTADQADLFNTQNTLFQRKKDVQDLKGRTFAELVERIPETIRTVSKNVMKTITGKDFSDLNLEEKGPGFLPLKKLGEAKTAKELHKAMTDSMREAGAPESVIAKVKIPTPEDMNTMYAQPNLVRYWYELSANGFTEKYFELPKPETEKLIDVVAATSGGQEPPQQMRFTIAAMSQDARGQPITVGFRDPSSVTGAFSPENLSTHKFGNFSGTMQLIAGLRNEKPLPTIDLQMAKLHGLDPAEVASDPRVYEAIARFWIKVRDMQNAELPKGEQPYESWQGQALGWVFGRGGGDPSDYASVMPKILEELKAAGIPLKDGKISEETLLDPRTADLLSPASTIFEKARIATVETATTNTAAGLAAAETRAALEGREEPWARNARNAYDGILRNAMKALGNRKVVADQKGKEPSLLSRLTAVVVGRNQFNLSRIDPYGEGTFEGQVNPNLRFPFSGRIGTTTDWVTMNETQRRGVLALIGKHLNQAENAASTFETVNAENAKTFSIFIKKYDKSDIDPKQLQALDKELGFPVNYSNTPNGWLIDVNSRTVNGLSEYATHDMVTSAADRVFKEDIFDTIPRDHGSDYLEAKDYDAAIKEMENAFRKDADARRGREAWSPKDRVRDLRAIGKEIAGIAKERDKSLRDWTAAAREKLGPDGAPDAGPAKEVKVIRVPIDQIEHGENVLAKDTMRQESRGSYDIAENLIRTMQGSDKSTVVHELGHSWLEEMRADAQRPNAPESIKADWELLRRELAIPSNGEIPRSSHEQWARSVERMLGEGEAPTPELASVFARFREWLLAIYNDLRNLNVEINPELKGILDRMLATDQEIADARELNVPRPYVEMARANEAAKIVPNEKPAPGFKDEQLAMEPFAEELLPGPGSGPTNDSRLNVINLDGPMRIKLALQRTAEIDQENVQKRRGGTNGVESWEETNAKADQLIEDMAGGKIDYSGLFDPAKRIPHNVQQRAVFKMLTSVTKHSLKLRDELIEKGQGATNEERLAYLESIVRMRMTNAELLGLRAESARAQNQMRQMAETSADIDQLVQKLFQDEPKSPAKFEAEIKAKLDEIMRTHFSGKDALDVAKLHKSLSEANKSLKAQLRFAKDITKATKWEMVVEGWKAGLLSGPQTPVTNVMGTWSFQALRAPVDAVAAIIGMARGASPGMGESDRASMSEAIARITGPLSGIQDGLKLAYHELKRDEPTEKVESFRTAIPGRAGEVIRFPFRLMSAGDALTTTMYKRGELKTLAIRKAFDEDLNPGTREFAERVNALMDKPTPEMQTEADAAANRMAFNQPAGEKIAAVQSFVKNWGLQWMVPFIRTPANIAAEMLRMSPFAPLVIDWRADFAKGGVARDKAIAEVVVGSGIMALTMAYAFEGQISGSGSPDPGKNRGKAGVWQPNSVLIGDRWYEIGRLQPGGTLMVLAADVANAWEHMTDDERDKVPKILAMAFSNAITNQTFLQGITNVVHMLSEPDRYGARFFQGLAASTVPNIIGQPTAMADPYVRQVNSILEAVQARIPGYRETLIPKRDWLGDKVETKERMGVVLPVREQKVSDDKVRLEAARMDISMADAPKKVHLGSGTGKLGDVELTPEERDKFAQIGGEFAHKILSNIVNAPGYDRMPDMLKKKMFARVLSASHKIAAMQALPIDKRVAYIGQIVDKVAAELAPE